MTSLLPLHYAVPAPRNLQVVARKSARKPEIASASFSAAKLEALIQALGTAHFAQRLVGAAAELLDVRHLAVIAFDDRLMAHVVAAESAGRFPIAKTAGEVYERWLLHRYDPNMKAVRSRTDGREPLLLRLRASDIREDEYRTRIFEQFRLVDRLSILDHSSGRWLALNLYREQRAGEFRPEDLRRVQEAAGVIAALVAKHFALLPPAPWQSAQRPSVETLEALVRELDRRLTTRQVQVCARALLGMTNVAVGLDLGIQVPTVATLRKRAYATLGISSLNELFALCLAAQRPNGSRADANRTRARMNWTG